MVTIPEQLRNPNFRFVPIQDGTKKPVGKLWSTTNNYLFDDQIFAQFKSYGVVCGFGNLLVVDMDDKDFQEVYLPLLPQTLTIQSPGSGLFHLYFEITDGTPQTVRLDNARKVRLADLQGRGTQVLGPGSIHPDTGTEYKIVKNLPIAKVKWAEVEQVFRDVPSTCRSLQSSTEFKRYKSHLCPFHDDHHPSMIEYIDFGTCFCFTCHAYGLSDILSHKGQFAEIRKTDHGTFYCVGNDDFARYLELRKEQSQNSDLSDFSVYHKKFLQASMDAFALQKKELYASAILAMAFSLHGLALRPQVLKIGPDAYDTRLSYIFCIKSGNGKKSFVEAATRYADQIGLRYAKATSLHAEQLVGSSHIRIEGRGANATRHAEEIEGYFRDDIIVVDDALPFLTRPDFEIARNYFIQAWDEHPRNQITKKQVAVERDEAIRYSPMCISYMFVQDIPIPKDNIITGLARKCPILYINAPPVDQDMLLGRALDRTEPGMSFFIKIAKIAKSTGLRWTFSEDCHRALAMRTYELLQDFREYGEKGISFAGMMSWTINNYFYKYAAILSATYELDKLSELRGFIEIEVTPEICEAAAKDASKVMWLAFAHWQKFSQEAPLKLNPWEHAIMESLHARKAFSEQSAVLGVPAWLEELATRNGRSVVTFYNALRNLSEKSLVERRILGKGVQGEENSKAWLKT